MKTGNANTRIFQNREENSNTCLGNEAGKRKIQFDFLVKTVLKNVTLMEEREEMAEI